MKIAIILLFLLLTAPSWASEKHIIFIIHGVTDSKEDFCDLDKLLLKKINSPDVETSYLEYDTNNEKLTVSDFVYSISKQIRDFMMSKNLPLDTPYSVVAHSQGGLVTMKFAQRCIIGKDKKCGKTAKNMQQFITLGTPFWSSPNAGRLTAIAKWGIPIPFYPDRQVEGLSSTSQLINNIRKQTIRNNEHSFWQNLRIFNIIGEVNYNRTDLLSFLERTALTLMYGDEETDLAVPTPSANLDFPYTIEKNDGTGYINKTSRLTQQTVYFPIPHTDMSCFKEGNHIKNELFPDAPDDTHTTNYATKEILPYITNIFKEHLWGEKLIPPKNKLEVPIRSFAVEIRFKIPGYIKRGITVNSEMVTIEEDSRNDRIETAIIGNAIASLNSAFKADRGPLNHAIYYHAGRFKEDSAHGSDASEAPQTRLNYVIKVPGFRTQRFYLDVQAGYSSYVEINLEPFTPFRDRKRAGHFEEDGVQKKLLFVYERKRVKNDDKKYLVSIFSEESQKSIITKWDEEDWQEYENALDEGVSLERFQNYCFLGTMGKTNTIHKNHVYKHPYDKEPETFFYEGKEVYILARVKTSKVDANGETIDRYLVTEKHPENVSGAGDATFLPSWVNVLDLDVTSTNLCD